MKLKKLATLLLSTTLVLASGVVAPFQVHAASVTVDGYSYSQEVVDALNYVNGIRSKMGLNTLKLYNAT